MEMWHIMMVAVIVTLGVKGITAHFIQQLRSELSIARREAMSSKEKLTEKKELLNSMRKDNRGKEHRITRLGQEIEALRERIESLKAEQQAEEDQEDQRPKMGEG